MHWEDPEGSGKEGGGRGDRDGEHVNPWLIHVNVWQKPLQYCKIISLQLIKINGKKKSACVYGTNSPQSGYRGNMPQPCKGWIW